MPPPIPEPCVIRQGIFGRWYIFHPHNIVDLATSAAKAWSGSRWVACDIDGSPQLVQVCNFKSAAEAREYCRENGLQPLFEK